MIDASGGRHRAVVARQAAQGVEPEDLELGVGAGQPLADHRVGGRPVGPGHLEQVVELPAERELVAEEAHAPLEGQGGQGHPPAVADLAHHVVRAGCGPRRRRPR